MSMLYRRLGDSGLEVSELCLGAMMFGDRTDAATAQRIVASAFDAGLWRRDHGTAATGFSQLFKPQFVPPQCTVPVPPAPPNDSSVPDIGYKASVDKNPPA